MRPINMVSAFRRTRAPLLLYILLVSLVGCEKNDAIDLPQSEAFYQQQPSDVRVMSWNVKQNSILPPDGVRQESFARIVRAIDPDVIALQEVMWPDVETELARLINRYIPLEHGRSWHVHTVSNNALKGTSVVILGDMNVVPDASMQPFKTLLSGNIIDEDTFGSDFRIDWDGTDMTDARPSHNALDREYYRWRNDSMQFEPSALDRIIFTDSVMSVRRRFVLNTMTMSADDLATLGLQQSDVLYGGDPNYYDHLPLVADLVIGTASLE